MDIKKASINGIIMDVTNQEEYYANPEIWPGYVAIEKNINGFDYVLPIRSSTSVDPGIYSYGSNCVDFVRLPSETQRSEYSADKIIDFNNTENIQDLIEKQRQVRDIEYDILCNPDNIFRPLIKPGDSEEMVGLKTAVSEKNIDWDKYKPRFGANAPNDKRLFDKSEATLKMIKRMCSKFDMKAELVLSDTSPDVPNPIGREIRVTLTGAGGEEDE